MKQTVLENFLLGLHEDSDLKQLMKRFMEYQQDNKLLNGKIML